MQNTSDFDRMLVAAQEELDSLDSRRKDILEQIYKLKREKALLCKKSSESSDDIYITMVNSQSSVDAKIALFRMLFRGREDVYARRYESVKTGKTGYFPACRSKGGRG